VGRQREVDVRAIKDRIRRRDGNRCVICQIDEQTHEKRFRQTLEVHRIVPGSDYSINWGVCVTLCEECHDAMHGHGHWGWIKKQLAEDADQLAYWVRRSSSRDLREEGSWRMHESWGSWEKQLRIAKQSSLFPKRKPGAPARRRTSTPLIARFARLSGLSEKTLRDFEAGRREPLLSEVRKLATALGITLEELASERDRDDGWRELCKERSDRRALVFRGREPLDGEIEGLDRAARLVLDLVARANEKRAEEAEAVRQAEEKLRREFLAKQRPVVL
jgi:transcriptional regulator with XRE-family HTH domain